MIFNEAGEVLLFHHTYRRDYEWGLPGGWMKRGEVPEEALARELLEETGFQIEVIRVLGVDADKVYARMDLVFEARLTGGEFRASEEVSEVGFFAMDALPKLLPRQVAFIQKLQGLENSA